MNPPSIEQSIHTSLSSDFFFRGDWPDSDWWEVFEDTALNTLISEALAHDPSLHSIHSRVEFAKQTAKVARSTLFPLLFFDFNESWESLSHHGLYRALNPQIPINANLIDLSLSGYYAFDFWGKNRNLFQAALGESKAQEAEAADVELMVTTSVAQAYFALKTNREREQLYQQLYTVRQAIFDLQNRLQDSALLSRLPPLLSEENLLEAEKLLFGIQEEIKTDQHLLNILMGRSPDTPFEITPGLLPTLQILTIPDNLSLDLLARRPDLMAQIWRVEALAHEVGAAKADFFPNINLKAFLGLESVFYHLLFKSSSKTAGLQPALHLPIFTAGAIRANLKAKKALFDAAVFDYNQLLLKSSGEVANVLAFALSIFEQMQDQDQIVQSAQSRYELTELRQQSGLDDLLTQFRMQEELILKQLDRIRLLYNQYVAAIKLTKSLGGGYQSAYAVPLRAEGEDR